MAPSGQNDSGHFQQSKFCHVAGQGSDILLLAIAVKHINLRIPKRTLPKLMITIEQTLPDNTG